MYVEIYVNGELKRTWHFDNDDLPRQIDEVVSNKRSERWKAITDNCRIESGMRPSEYENYEMFISIRARVQPGDISDADMKKFDSFIASARLRKAKQNSKLAI